MATAGEVKVIHSTPMPLGASRCICCLRRPIHIYDQGSERRLARCGYRGDGPHMSLPPSPVLLLPHAPRGDVSASLSQAIQRVNSMAAAPTTLWDGIAGAWMPSQEGALCMTPVAASQSSSLTGPNCSPTVRRGVWSRWWGAARACRRQTP